VTRTISRYSRQSFSLISINKIRY